MEKLSDKKANILVTGPPGCGKSTLLEKIARHYSKKAVGFFTRELRQGKRRAGFEIETIGGEKGVLAHRDIDGADRVGPYGVDVGALEQIAVPALTPPDTETIVIVDEIGKMEWMSEYFQAAVWRVHDFLADDPPAGDLDIVFLRNNLLTYYAKQLAEPPLERVIDALRPVGFLVIGAKEEMPAAGLRRLRRYDRYVFRKHVKPESEYNE